MGGVSERVHLSHQLITHLTQSGLRRAALFSLHLSQRPNPWSSALAFGNGHLR